MILSRVKNQEAIAVSAIPTLSYEAFGETVSALLTDPSRRCVCYHGVPQDGGLQFFCGIADDQAGDITLLSYRLPAEVLLLPSLTPRHQALHVYEREIHENHGVAFDGHPWQKAVRYPHDRADQTHLMDDYPFYTITGAELHEVGVGPIHAGVIEPGHFRFVCNGEMVLHLEIQLGYQHRGVEALMLNRRSLLQRTVLAESIAGDTAIGHTYAFVAVMEALSDAKASLEDEVGRAVALELERIGIHTGDLSALCTDVAYQLGAAALGALRTPIINAMQSWCGNRFGKGLIRFGGHPFPLTPPVGQQLLTVLEDYEARFVETAEKMFSIPSVLQRFEKTGVVTREQALLLGAVGMTARTSGVPRDARTTHPIGVYASLGHEPITLSTGDVYARALLRRQEIVQSLHLIRRLIAMAPSEPSAPHPTPVVRLRPSHLCVSLVEGWRGEICHVALTDDAGELLHYKINDPSLHNWFALALAVRNNEISDFPVCNKSFNLSYCGHDL